jgi:hypothetical protein
VLADGEQVGETLARVVVICEGVDHRNRCHLGDLLHHRLLERPDHDGVAVSFEHFGGVVDALTARESAVVAAHDDGMRTEPNARDLERDASSH